MLDPGGYAMRKLKLTIGIIGCLLLCSFGIYSLMRQSTNSLFYPALIAITGLIGAIEIAMELKNGT